MSIEIFADRADAGRKLAQALEVFRHPDLLVLGVPRGGMVLAAIVARELGAPLDVVLAHKLGAPMQPELAIGAVVSGDSEPLLDVRTIELLEVEESYIKEEAARQLSELERRLTSYRGTAQPPDIRGKRVIVVDDGIATGYTIRAALRGLRRQHPETLIVAVPVAPESTVELLQEDADKVVCLQTPEPFLAVGAWYQDFDQTTDEEVRFLLSDSLNLGAVDSG